MLINDDSPANFLLICCLIYNFKDINEKICVKDPKSIYIS